ncbi:MAG: Fic family protein [Elusimicrobia bacterium]|nr:Fic family protein [Elusimicrobiota bacterium]
MKIPETPPKYTEVLKNNREEIINALIDPEVIDFLTKEEQEYNYWDKFKYLKMPKNLDPKIIWSCREIRRSGKLIDSPIKSKDSQYFSYTLTPVIEKTLHQTDRNMPFIAAEFSQDAFDSRAMIIRSLMEEAIASSRIEGAAATRRKAKEMLATKKKPSNSSEQMILNNYTAINYIRKLKEKPLSKEILLDLHRILSEETLDSKEIGRFRQSPLDDNVEIIDSDGTVLHKPPHGKYVESMLNDLIEFANTNKGAFIHPLIKGILLHFWLAWIHPFCDGNGRTARAIFYWYMLKEKYWAFEYLSISRIVLNKEGQYKRAFLNTELSGDLTYFLMFNSKIINEAAKEVHDYIKRRLKQECLETDILKKFSMLNQRQRKIIFHAKAHSGRIYTIRRHQIQNNIAYATARSDILGLVKLGLFTAMGSSKIHEFTPISEKLK